MNLKHSLSISRLIRYCILSKTFVVSLRRVCFEPERDTTTYFIIQGIILYFSDRASSYDSGR